VNYTALKEEAGILAVVFDKDNTLTAPYDSSLHPAAAPGISRAIQVFGRDKVGRHMMMMMLVVIGYGFL
jgi:Mitochondrial PGP phosphatase